MDQVRNASLAHDVHPSWLWGTMRQESAYNKSAHSVSGARGLIQIMPETGRFIADRRGASTFDPDTLWDPSLNVDYAAWYFDYLRTEIGSGNLQEVLAAYNGGPGRLRQYRTQLPTRDIDIFLNAIPREETRNFTHWVYENIIMYQNIMKDKDFQEIPF
jgi:soluble lytic murein transglycosylase